MFNLEEYKKQVIEYYHCEKDSTKEEKIRRRKMFSIRYNDEYLLNIIKNTEEFIYHLITKKDRTRYSNVSYGNTASRKINLQILQKSKKELI